MRSKTKKICKIIGLYVMLLLGGIFLLPQSSMAADMAAQPTEAQQGETSPVDAQILEQPLEKEKAAEQPGVDAQTVEAQMPATLTHTISQTGWIKTGENWWYREADGSFPLKEWKLLNQIWYYFDENGWMVTGWQDIGGARYYFNTAGFMLTGWQHIDENDYYLQASGAMAVNTWIGDYYVDGNGVWDKSKHKEEIKTGWVKSDEKWKYYGTDGNCVKDEWKTVGGAWYLFDKEGWMLTGWQKVSGTSYYMDASGRMLTGWQKISGSWYYLNSGGAMLTGWQRIGGMWYYMESSGKMMTGWQKLGQTWYYMDEGGRMLTGWQKIGNSWYYMDDSGAMAQDTWIGTYYVDANGSWIPGRIQKAQWVKSGSRWWYQEKDGSYPVSSWKAIGGAWYYFDGAGWMTTGWQSINKVWYYLNESGQMQTGWQKLGSSWYYLNSSGQMLTGWQKIGSSWYYLNGSGVMLTGWQQINKVWYYLNGSGVMQTGWQKIGSSWYYLLENGSMVTGWQTIGGHKYYLYDSGAMACSTTVDGVVLNASGQAIEVESGSGTLRGFLETSLAPVGETLYVYGGGHDGDAGGDAVRIGVNPQWKTFYNQQGATYDYTKYRYWHGYGLDCSGLVG